MLHAIGSGMDDDYTERKRRDLLLELGAAVHREQNVISLPHAPQQLAILDPGPTASGHSLNSMAVEFSGNSCSSRRTRIGHKRLARQIKYSDRFVRASQMGISAETRRGFRRPSVSRTAIQPAPACR